MLDKGLGLNAEFGIHIWLTTHSPFLLSDFAQKNITYLENGQWLKETELRKREMVNPLLANVNDILYHSFFLTHDFSGLYAKKKILSLLDFLKGKNHDWNKATAKVMIDNVGKRLIKRMLTDLYQKKFLGRLGINAYVYCNEAIITSGEKNENGNHEIWARYEVDHFYPKDKYPYLSTSFYFL